MNGMNALELENVSKSFGDFSLRDVSFRVPMGSALGLIGENGAGKSTTISLILGLLDADGGQIRVLDRPQDENFTQVKEKIGVVLDESCFPDGINALQADRIAQCIYKNWNSATYFEHLRRFDLPPKKPFKDFSRGMKMKLSLAVALSHNAKLLILDEPTSGLDPVVRSEILDIFLEFISDGERSILVSSHITSDLERIADYITFIHQGKVLLSENKDEILYGYGIAKAGREQLHRVDRTLVAAIQDTPYGSEALILDRERFEREYPDIVLDPVDFDEMMVLLCRGQKL